MKFVCLTLCMVWVSATGIAGGPCTAPAGIGDPGKLVLLDCYFNNEWKRDDAGRLFRYHYVWEDTANSGYSLLAGIITKAGGTVGTCSEAPTSDVLQRASVYLIVDPDTPVETAHPHTIDDRTIKVITQWVRQGGALLLFGNDKGNAEFDHLNRLAGRFGIHFNEDSRNRVTGKNFEVGTFEKLPDHPLFAGVRRIFIKELSTLQVHEPAQVVLSDGGDVIMAFARWGEGCVFAVGDPWFYNEYMDSRRLPEGYDNPRAAENLFRWLFQGASQER